MDLRRRIDWPGAYNVRDLGGLACADGGETAFGRVYRSGRVEYITDDGWRAAIDHGLAVIVDLRNCDERVRRATDPEVDERLAGEVPRVRRPVEDVSNEAFVRLQDRDGFDHPRSYRHHMDELPELVVEVLRALVEVDLPVLMHCQQGRDRTGMMTAVLLTLNGVSTDAIGADYELAARAANDDLLARPSPGGEQGLAEADLIPRIAERRAALIAWLDSADLAGALAAAGLSSAELDRASRLLRA